jgi:hypothetical protein
MRPDFSQTEYTLVQEDGSIRVGRDGRWGGVMLQLRMLVRTLYNVQKYLKIILREYLFFVKVLLM